MKIIDAQERYRSQIQSYRSEMSKVAKRRKEIQEQLKGATGEDKEALDKEAATIELTYKSLQDKQDEYYDYMNSLADQWCAWANAESSKQQGEEMKKYYEDLGKIMEVARRLMKGDIVSSTDEKKLIDYNDKLYQMAKNMGEMAKAEKRKKHKSLWEDEEEKQYDDPEEVANNKEVQGEAPQLVSASDIMSGAGYSSPDGQQS